MKRQTSNGLPEQLSFGWGERGRAGHGPGSDAVSEAAGQVAEQVPTAEERIRALKQDLMEKVAEEANLLEALRRVCANKGSAGVDGMDVTELKAWMSVRANREKLRDKLISGTYEPAPVRGVQIPKPGGKGVRQLGIPTVSSYCTGCSRVLGLSGCHSIGVGYPGLQPGSAFRAEGDPIGRPWSKLACFKVAAFDPVIDHADADAKMLGHFPDG